MSSLLGIDLGTTNSLCAIFREGQPCLIPNSQGNYMTPSVVGVLKSGQIVVGEAARELMITKPERTRARFKRWMGTERIEQIGVHRLTPEDLSSLVLRSLKRDAEAWLGHDVDEAVITVPAYFNELQRQATRVAGELAGLRVRRLLNEPSAAALAYGLIEPHTTKRMMVLDLGGGTFDVTLMDVFEGTLEIIGSAGDGYLGGEDFTEAIVYWMLRKLPAPLERTEAQEPLRVGRLRSLAEHAKKVLSQEAATHVLLPDADGTLPVDQQGSLLTRVEFDELTAKLRQRLMQPVQRVLRDAHLDPSQIDDIVLAGGATKDPAVLALVEQIFGQKPRCSEDPDLVVAHGAAIQAALVADDAAVRDLVMTDVSPHTLGIEVTKRIASTMRDGYFLPIITRNTTIPVAREETVTTLEHGQSRIDLRVYQGESRRVSENLLLGTLEVNGIPYGPAGKEVAVRFAYDPNGLLEVEAVVLATGHRFQTTMTLSRRQLEPAQVAAARKRLDQVKFYPRDDEQNLRLLLFAERVVGQVAPFHRANLEEVVDAYERVLRSTDRNAFESIRGALCDHLTLLGFPFDGTAE